MIKLIASDLDGTLLWGKEKIIRQESVELIEALLEQGRIFMAASGRQYANQRRLFQESGLSDKIGFVCENGSLIMHKNKILKQYFFERELGIELMKSILDKSDCEVLLSGVNTSYIQPKNPAFETHMREFVRNNVTVVEDICAVEEPFMKISAYKKDEILPLAHDWDEQFQGRMNIALADEIWLDFGPLESGKGKALLDVCDYFGFTADELLVLGDNFNDISMFEVTKNSFVMENGPDEVKPHANHVAKDINDVLKDILEGKYD